MFASLFFWTKYGLLPKGSSDSPPQDNIPLSQLPKTPTLQDRISEGRPPFEVVFEEVEVNPGDGNRRARNYWHFLCYFLHAFLVALHLILLVIAASHHSEHQVSMSFDASVGKREIVTTGLSVGLQAFYTFYTALLVFVTQKLMLSAILSGPKKLTQIHDIYCAWAGVGAALNTLWQQTKVASSVPSIVFVTVYFACISVLHVASSTLMQFQTTNHTMTSLTSPVRQTWPDTSVDLESMDWMAVTPLAPFLQAIYKSQTIGLVNNTLYDSPVGLYFTATVNATTLNANCGLLPNLSIDALEDGTWIVNSSMSGLDPISINVPYPPLLNEIWFSPSIQCLGQICSSFILFLVSAEMEVDDLVDVNYVYINGTYYPPGGISQTFSTPIQFVACSLNATNHNVTLGSSGTPLDPGEAQTDVPWSTFSPGGDLNLTSAISYAMKSANSLPSSPYCQPIMSYPALWANITAFNAYMRSTLGMDVSPCFGTPVAQYASTLSSLTRGQFESTVSQIAAEFIWLAGKLGEVGGGFDPQITEQPLVCLVQSLDLNINHLPVILALCASVILLILVICVLWRRPPAVVSAAGVLEIMWFGSRSRVLRDHLSNMQTPSLDGLRASSMFETILWTRSAYGHEGSSNVCSEVVPLHGVETHTSRPSGSGVYSDRTDAISRMAVIASGNPRSGAPSQRRDPNISRGTLRWCYALHIMLVALHVTLLTCLVHHPENSVGVPYDDMQTMNIILSALLQAIYTLYSALLVLLVQRLALLKIVSERRKLTIVHDVSRAWTGIGATIQILWQQRKRSSSTRKIIVVGAYLSMMLILHITSSSIMRWQGDTLNPFYVSVQVNLSMPDNAVDISQLGWAEIFPMARSIIQDVGMLTAGLLNNTLYDVTTNNSVYTLNTMNLTTLTAQCGLVPNLTLSSQNSDGQYRISFQNGTNNGSFLESPIWKDVVHSIVPSTECIACPQTLFYMITTGVNVDESIHDPVSVKLNWTYTPASEEGNAQTSTTLTYIAACSLSAQRVLSSMNDWLSNQLEPPSPSTSWSVWSPENATNLNVGMTTALSKDITGSFSMFVQGSSSTNFTDMDSYIMSSLGLNLTYANETSVSQSSVSSSVTLSPGQLEDVIAQTAATFLWTAGQVGESGGGFQRSKGETQGTVLTSPFTQLNVNTIPVIFASIASFLSLILATIIIGKGPSREHSTSISGTSVLECLWLEAQSELLHFHLQKVEKPRLDTLRAAGMFEIRLGDIGRSSYPEAERPILEPVDG